MPSAGSIAMQLGAVPTAVEPDPTAPDGAPVAVLIAKAPIVLALKLAV